MPKVRRQERTFMSLWELVEEKEGHCILEEGITQQLKALIGVVLLADFRSECLQHIYYVWRSAQRWQSFKIMLAVAL